MKIVIALGNPDVEYALTRHNIGWLFLDWLAKKAGAPEFKHDKSANALVAKAVVDGNKVILAKPLTYVNSSGMTAGKLRLVHKAKPEQFILIHDDLDIPFGDLKNSFAKNSGGHRGVESIIKALKTNAFYRLRLGIAVRALDKARDQSDKKRDVFVKDFVLKRFTPGEQEKLKPLFKEAYERLAQLLKQ